MNSLHGMSYLRELSNICNVHLHRDIIKEQDPGYNPHLHTVAIL
jgi:hypothetical protein